MNELAVWFGGGDKKNFGDALGVDILARLGYNAVRVASPADADLIACGSIIDAVAPYAKPGCIVWGSGLMHPEAVDVSHMDVRAVRGRLTANTLGVDVPMADPATLVPELWDRPVVRRKIGLVRHFVDEDPYGWADGEISTHEPVDDVIDFIGSSERIVSSSLHGLIVATAWGIPCVRVHHPEVLGGNFKWMDWMTGDADPEDLVGVLP